MGRTSLALANLRALTILLVVSFHSVLAYLGSQPAAQPAFDAPPYTWRAFPILDSQRWFGFDLYCALLYVFLMPLFFFMSGLFVWQSLSRRGGKAFAYSRAVRIGVPFVLGTAILMPAAHYPVYRVTAADPGWSAFWAHWTALPYWPDGRFGSCGSFWCLTSPPPRCSGNGLALASASPGRKRVPATSLGDTSRASLWFRHSLIFRWLRFSSRGTGVESGRFPCKPPRRRCLRSTSLRG